MQSEVGVNVCEYHIFDMGNYGNKVPKELKRAYYHQWGLMRQGGKAPESLGRTMKMGEKHAFKGLKDTIVELGHEALDVIDIFVSNRIFFFVLKKRLYKYIYYVPAMVYSIISYTLSIFLLFN